MTGWTEVQTNWAGENDFTGTNLRDGSVHMGTGKSERVVSPMEMLLMGMAGCTGMDVVHILNRMREELTDLSIRVKAKRAESHPMVFTEIEVEITLTGRNLSETAVQRAIELSEEKYCSASIMLGKTAKITTNYEIIQVD